tara:strand:- start:536 stop:2461 length:1926 start_codon:yes stop_codon:yes gene_type:complete
MSLSNHAIIERLAILIGWERNLGNQDALNYLRGVLHTSDDEEILRQAKEVFPPPVIDLTLSDTEDEDDGSSSKKRGRSEAATDQGGKKQRLRLPPKAELSMIHAEHKEWWKLQDIDGLPRLLDEVSPEELPHDQRHFFYCYMKTGGVVMADTMDQLLQEKYTYLRCIQCIGLGLQGCQKPQELMAYITNVAEDFTVSEAVMRKRMETTKVIFAAVNRELHMAREAISKSTGITIDLPWTELETRMIWSIVRREYPDPRMLLTSSSEYTQIGYTLKWRLSSANAALKVCADNHPVVTYIKRFIGSERANNTTRQMVKDYIESDNKSFEDKYWIEALIKNCPDVPTKTDLNKMKEMLTNMNTEGSQFDEKEKERRGKQAERRAKTKDSKIDKLKRIVETYRERANKGDSFVEDDFTFLSATLFELSNQGIDTTVYSDLKKTVQAESQIKRLLPVDKSTPTYKEIEQWVNTLPNCEEDRFRLELTDVKRVYYPTLRDKFCREINRLKRSWMLHGTRGNKTKDVALSEQGMDSRHSTHGMFGKAVYFTLDKGYVAQWFAHQPNYPNSDEVEMILATVFHGDRERLDYDDDTTREKEIETKGFQSAIGTVLKEGFRGAKHDVDATMVYEGNRSRADFVLTFKKIKK